MARATACARARRRRRAGGVDREQDPGLGRTLRPRCARSLPRLARRVGAGASRRPSAGRGPAPDERSAPHRGGGAAAGGCPATGWRDARTDPIAALLPPHHRRTAAHSVATGIRRLPQATAVESLRARGRAGCRSKKQRFLMIANIHAETSGTSLRLAHEFTSIGNVSYAALGLGTGYFLSRVTGNE